MTDYMDFFNLYLIGYAQVLTGFYFLTRFLHKKMRPGYYFLFAIAGFAIINAIPSNRMTELLTYAVFLALSGILLCHANIRSSILYAALTVEIMQLCYGITDSLSGILYPFLHSFDPQAVGIFLMAAGNAALPAAVCCYCMAAHCFSDTDTAGTQYLLMILTPILMLFLMGEHNNSILLENRTVTLNSSNLTQSNGVISKQFESAPYVLHIRILIMQFLEMGSLFCILSAYKKLLQNFHLRTELSLLEQEEHSLNQYVEEAKSRYEETRSFRHDIKNHLAVIKNLLQNGKTKQALNYVKDMEETAEELSFPISTNHPVVDILLGNKLAAAQNMGIDISCSLSLPYPCSIRDIDFCIILSNALDNAIHACKRMDGAPEDSARRQEKFIRVSGRIQGDFLLLEVENSFCGKKLPEKGIGLSNIRSVSEKYHGTMHIKTTASAFLLSVLLIIPQQTQDLSRQTTSSSAPAQGHASSLSISSKIRSAHSSRSSRVK